MLLGTGSDLPPSKMDNIPICHGDTLSIPRHWFFVYGMGAAFHRGFTDEEARCSHMKFVIVRITDENDVLYFRAEKLEVPQTNDLKSSQQEEVHAELYVEQTNVDERRMA